MFLIQGNAIIIDTPDFGDLEQKHVAEKMMTYLPNALAFVFVINAANTGGLQEHRVLIIRCIYIKYIYLLINMMLHSLVLRKTLRMFDAIQ